MLLFNYRRAQRRIPGPCRNATRRRHRLTLPRYGIPFYRLSGYWQDAERMAHTTCRTRALARYAAVIRQPGRSSAQAIGRAAIQLAHLCDDYVVGAALRRVIGGG